MRVQAASQHQYSHLLALVCPPSEAAWGSVRLEAVSERQTGQRHAAYDAPTPSRTQHPLAGGQRHDSPCQRNLNRVRLIMTRPNKGKHLSRVGRSNEPRQSTGPSEHAPDRL